MKRQYKWFFTIGAIVVFLIFGGMLPGEPLSNRAMVVGFGVDLIEGKELNVSAQILNLGSSSEKSSQASQVVTAKRHTIAGAMNIISEKAGLSVALTHCNVVFIGEELAKSPQMYSVLNYLITNNYLSENAFLFVTRGKAEELLNSKTAFGGNASLYTQKLVGMGGEFDDLARKTLQEFLVDYHRLGQGNWLPLIDIEAVAPEISESAGTGGSQETSYVFDIHSVMVFRKNVFIGEYGPDETVALNFVVNKVNKGTVEGDGDNGEKIIMYILGKEKKIKYDLEGKTVSLELEIETLLKEIIDYGENDEFVDRTHVTDAEIKRAEENIVKKLQNFYADLQKYDADVFGFYDGFYSKFGKKALDLKLADVTFETKVKIEVHDI